MPDNEVLVSVEIKARHGQIELTTMRRGKGRHSHYNALNQAPPELRGEALELIRTALVNSGYESLTDLEAALTAELVVPDEEDEDKDTD